MLDELVKLGARQAKKAAIKTRKYVRKAKKAVADKIPDGVKETYDSLKEVGDEATSGVKKSYDLAKKKVAAEKTSKKQLDKQLKSGEVVKHKEAAFKDGKKSRYFENTVYSRKDKNTGEYIPIKNERALNKKQIIKDVGAGAALAGIGVGAVKANESLADDLREMGSTEMVEQIKRKMREGKELTQSEKRLLRLMEE